MAERICTVCGKPAQGFASIWQDGKESWYCHPDEGPSCYELSDAVIRVSPDGKRTVMNANDTPPFAEVFWGGYLTVLHETGAVTIDTPAAEVEQIKAEFMAGMRGETS